MPAAFLNTFSTPKLLVFFWVGWATEELWKTPRTRSQNLAMWSTGRMPSSPELLARALESALLKAGKDSDFRLKDEQKAIIEAVVCKKKDVLGVLPTGFGKSLIFHLLSDVFDFVDSHRPPVKGKSITVVISPLNALMRDQISKLDHLGAIILDGTINLST